MAYATPLTIVARMTSERIKLAQKMCKKWHEGQERKYTGEPYHVHPFEVAKILKDHGGSEDLQIAGLLHDVVEDCEVTEDEIADMFGDRVADLVMMVTDVSRPEDGNREARKALDRAHNAKADAEGQTLKLADLISNSTSIAKYGGRFADTYMREKEATLKLMKKGDSRLRKLATQIVEDFWAGWGQ